MGELPSEFVPPAETGPCSVQQDSEWFKYNVWPVDTIAKALSAFVTEGFRLVRFSDGEQKEFPVTTLFLQKVTPDIGTLHLEEDNYVAEWKKRADQVVRIEFFPHIEHIRVYNPASAEPLHEIYHVVVVNAVSIEEDKQVASVVWLDKDRFRVTFITDLGEVEEFNVPDEVAILK